jgi:hypothetical protein
MNRAQEGQRYLHMADDEAPMVLVVGVAQDSCRPQSTVKICTVV